MRAQNLLISCIIVCVGLFIVVVDATTIGDHCSEDFQKVVACLNYATGKAAEPTKECCTSVGEIKDKDPVCLCYVMQQTLNGSEQIKSMGIQVSRLLQLPTACKLTNASVSDCPKLLNIPTTSPEYKIFTNISSASPSTPSSRTGTSLPTTAADSSKNGPQLVGLVPIAISIMIFFTFPCS